MGVPGKHLRLGDAMPLHAAPVSCSSVALAADDRRYWQTWRLASPSPRTRPITPAVRRPDRLEEGQTPVGGDGFARVLVGEAGGVVGKRVAGIDLDEIVDDQHLQHPQDIHRYIAVLGENDGEQAERPGMFGIVLAPKAAGIDRLPQHLFQAIAFDEEHNLPRKTFNVVTSFSIQPRLTYAGWPVSRGGRC
jgi:hypothetical protein